jgi:hypothetical protein
MGRESIVRFAMPSRGPLSGQSIARLSTSRAAAAASGSASNTARRKRSASRVAAATPAAAVTEFERVLTVQAAHLEDAVADCNDDDVASVFKEYGEEVGRALDELKRVMPRRAPRRPRKRTEVSGRV